MRKKIADILKILLILYNTREIQFTYGRQSYKKHLILKNPIFLYMKYIKKMNPCLLNLKHIPKDTKKYFLIFLYHPGTSNIIPTPQAFLYTWIHGRVESKIYISIFEKKNSNKRICMRILISETLFETLWNFFFRIVQESIGYSEKCCRSEN